MPALEQTILDALPHQPPFRFITRIVELDPGASGRAIWAVTGDEWFLTGHFPGNPIVPGVLLGEALAQLAGVVCLAGNGAGQPAAGRLASMDMRYNATVTPPAEVHLHATVARNMGRLYQCDVHATCQGNSAARGRVVLASMLPEHEEATP